MARMGVYMHHAIVVSGGNEQAMYRAAAKAAQCGCSVTSIVGNRFGLHTFCVAPDGSKEGWDASNAGNAAREKFIAWLRTRGTACTWVEVRFGPDCNALATAHHNDGL
jgi:hypothetical protein